MKPKIFFVILTNNYCTVANDKKFNNKKIQTQKHSFFYSAYSEASQTKGKEISPNPYKRHHIV